MGKDIEINDSVKKDDTTTSQQVDTDKTNEVTHKKAEEKKQTKNESKNADELKAKESKETSDKKPTLVEKDDSIKNISESDKKAVTSSDQETSTGGAKSITKKTDSNSKPKDEDVDKNETNVKVKPKAKAVVLAPLEETTKNPAPKTIEINEVKPKTETKPANIRTTAKTTKTNQNQSTEGDQATNSSKNQDLKLPLFRRIHIKTSYIIGGIIVMLLAFFFGRVALWEHDYLARMEGSERHTTASENTGIGDDGEEVDTTEPTEVEVREYIVAADKPRYFSIPSLGIYNARIVELGVKDNGELATPGNIYDMGWYTGSSLPGELGVSMFDGHGGDIGYGILKTLPRIAVGAIIKIEMGDGRVFNYRVADTAVKAIGDEANNYMTTAFSTPEGSRSSLSIITCTGDYWQHSQTYSHRFFLRAVLES